MTRPFAFTPDSLDHDSALDRLTTVQAAFGPLEVREIVEGYLTLRGVTPAMRRRSAARASSTRRRSPSHQPEA